MNTEKPSFQFGTRDLLLLTTILAMGLASVLASRSWLYAYLTVAPAAVLRWLPIPVARPILCGILTWSLAAALRYTDYRAGLVHPINTLWHANVSAALLDVQWLAFSSVCLCIATDAKWWWPRLRKQMRNAVRFGKRNNQ